MTIPLPAEKPFTEARPCRNRRQREPEITAEQFIQPFDLRFPEGVCPRYELDGQELKDGDWIVRIDGVAYIMTPEEFEANYELAK